VDKTNYSKHVLPYRSQSSGT